MASTKREIKTTLSLDGEKQFKDAISDSKSELKVLGSELKELTSAYKLNGDQMGYLTSKASVLKREIAEQEKIVAQTAEMYHKAADGGEAFVGKAQRLNIQLNNSRAALNRMKAELQATDRELEELGRDSIAAGRDIERGLTDAAQDASREIKDMVTETEGSLGKMTSLFSGGVGIAATIGSVAGVGVGIFNMLTGFAEAGAEYTLTVGKLRANAEVQGADWDFIQNEMLRVTAITGDADVAVQGISAILNTGVQDAQTLTSLVDMLTGATIKYTDLDFGGVASDLQKTVSQREAVGFVADVVKGLGYDVEDVNRELQMAETDAGALNIVMGYLAEDGLEEVYRKYYDINGAIIDARTEQERLNAEWQSLGSNIMAWFEPVFAVLADVTRAINGGITGEVDFWQGVKNAEKILAETDWGKAHAEYIDTFAPWSPLAGAPGQKEWPDELDASLVPFVLLRADKVGLAAQGAVKHVEESLTDMMHTTAEVLEIIEDDAQETGGALGAAYTKSINDALDVGIEEIFERVNRIDRILQGPTSGTPFYGGGGGGRPETTNVVINMELDGHRMGAALVPYIDSAMGKQQARTNFG